MYSYLCFRPDKHTHARTHAHTHTHTPPSSQLGFTLELYSNITSFVLSVPPPIQDTPHPHHNKGWCRSSIRLSLPHNQVRLQSLSHRSYFPPHPGRPCPGLRGPSSSTASFVSGLRATRSRCARSCLPRPTHTANNTNINGDTGLCHCSMIPFKVYILLDSQTFDLPAISSELLPFPRDRDHQASDHSSMSSGS